MTRELRHLVIRAVLASSFVVAVGSGVSYAQSSTVPADNSAQNQRDRNHQTMTPMDQSNKAEDLAISRRIRESIVKDQQLSTDAKNIKIITVDRAVTLRAVVKTDAVFPVHKRPAQACAR